MNSFWFGGFVWAWFFAMNWHWKNHTFFHSLLRAYPWAVLAWIIFDIVFGRTIIHDNAIFFLPPR